ncbi:LOW QUALITY PROTEIN: uncharacterized protein LOC124466092 [Hypomesus transpacificus]|uniref:LOW QUALITY PROTEIN: uncharacterized protein LOC124466092 n=1 Tax=Hypomesus transpacificus TaxID=137520 RepID=UPI001F077FEF|nr:LOW QUALITY PROTEIN: uncharacterized protein LOC124466092 [Hypomesus transpacificus]
MGCNHEELFLFFLNSSEATPSVPLRVPPGKATAKGKRGSASRPAAAFPAKKARLQGLTPTGDPVLEALSDIKMSVGDMAHRITVLEAGAAPEIGLAQGVTHPAVTSDRAVVPWSSLASAVPAAASGAPFLSPAAGLSAHLRNQIIAGMDINLVQILLGATDLLDKRLIDCGDVSVFLKGSDPRMSKNLTLAEFCVAFGVYRDTLCKAYPERRVELDDYLALIADLALRYGSSLFYEYHKCMSAKAALHLQKWNLRLDWSVKDLDLVSRVFTGHMPISCSVCGSLGHSVNLCPRTAYVAAKTERTQEAVGLPKGGRKKLLRGRSSPSCVPSSGPPGPEGQVNKRASTPVNVERPCFVMVSPIGVATRKYSGKKRLIIDLSAPHGCVVPSINSLIPHEPFSLCYASVDNAIHMIKIAGGWLGKADVVDAFKVMPLRPSQWHLFGVRWRGKHYFAVRLTFGCRSSPRIFCTLSEALCWILLNVRKLPFVLHLLDDFLVVDFPCSPPARCITVLRDTFDELGVPLSDEKTVGPLTSLEFLGIQLDSVLMQASLPAEKLERIRSVMGAASSAVSMSKREMLSLLGHLTFAMRIIPQGRSFVSRLLDLCKTVANLQDTLVLDVGCRSDLSFWALLCAQWNGISFFYNDEIETSAALEFYTDAALSIGFGGYHGDEWFCAVWPAEILSLPLEHYSSALHELYPIVISCLLWGHLWCRKKITVFCDNEAAVHIINKGRSSVPVINRLVRRLTWTCVLGNFILRAAYVPGLANQSADSLSRFKLQEFRALRPHASPYGLSCPTFQQAVLD